MTRIPYVAQYTFRNKTLNPGVRQQVASALSEHLRYLQAFEVQFNDDKALVHQVLRWSTLLNAEQLSLSTLERRMSRAYRQRAELQGEMDLILLDIAEVATTAESEAAQHQKMMTQLKADLRALECSLSFGDEGVSDRTT